MSAAVREQGKVDDLLLHLKGLVLVRALLESRGASHDEVAAHDDEIARVRAELAHVARKAAA